MKNYKRLYSLFYSLYTKIKPPFLLYISDNNENHTETIINMFLEYKKSSNNNLKLLVINDGKNMPYNKHITIINNPSKEKEPTIFKKAIAVLCKSKDDIEKAWNYGTAIIVSDFLKDICIKSNSGLYYSNYAEFVECIDMLYNNPTIRNLFAINGKKYINYRKIAIKDNKISFDEACERFVGVYNLLNAVDKYVDFENKIVLDVGFGIGTGLIALIKKGASKAVGIDINFNEFGYNYFNEISELQNITQDKIKLIEGDICDENIFNSSEFDIIISIDTFEHINDPKTALKNCKKFLRKGGYIIISISPLYYSPIGSHLWPYFPKESEPWAHLRYDDVTKIKKINEWHLKHFKNLNKLTINEMRNYINLLNLEIILEDIKKSGKDMYDKFKQEINLKNVPDKEDLFNESVIYILKK